MPLIAVSWPSRSPGRARDGLAMGSSRSTGRNQQKRRASCRKMPKTPQRIPWPRSARSQSLSNRTTSRRPFMLSKTPTNLRLSLSFAQFCSTAPPTVPCLHLLHPCPGLRRPRLRPRPRPRLIGHWLPRHRFHPHPHPWPRPLWPLRRQHRLLHSSLL